MITIKELEKREESRKARVKALEAEIAAARAEATEAANAAEKAARAGFLAEYNRKTSDKQAAEAREYVASAQLSTIQAPEVTAAEAQEAWSNYRAGYEKDFQRNSDRLNKARAEFLAAFGDLLDLQSEGLRQREKLGGWLGIHPDQATSGDAAFNQFPLQTMPTEARIKNALTYLGLSYSGEAAFYAYQNNMELASEDMTRLYRIMSLRRAHPEGDR